MTSFFLATSFENPEKSDEKTVLNRRMLLLLSQQVFPLFAYFFLSQLLFLPDVANPRCISYNKWLYFGSLNPQNLERDVPKTAISVAVNEWITHRI